MKKILLIFVLLSISVNSQTKIHHQILGVSPINSLSDNQFYANLGGFGQNIFTKVTLAPLKFEYLAKPNFSISMTSYAFIEDNGIAIDYLGNNHTTTDNFKTLKKETESKFKKVIRTSSGIIALGNDYKIYFTEDAINWEAKANGTVLWLRGDFVWGKTNNDKLTISENGGKTWENSIDLSQFDSSQQQIFVVNTSIIVVRENGKGKLHITSDKGITWKTTETLPNSILKINFIDKDTGFVFITNSTLCTKNGGENWTDLANFFPTLPESGTPELVAVMKNIIVIKRNGKLFYSKDKGNSWVLFHQIIGGKFYDIDQKGDIVIIGGKDGYYAISKNGGKLFEPYKWGKEDIMAVKVIDENTYGLGDRKGQVLMLYEGGNNWGKKTSSSGNYNALHFEVSSDKNIVIMTRKGQPAVSTDNAKSFKYVTVGGGTHYQTLKPNGEIIDVTQSGLITKIKASNGQKTELSRINGITVRRITMTSNNTGYIFAFKDSKTLSTYVTRDGWGSFQKSGDITISKVGEHISVSHIADGHLIITVDNVNEMYETKDYGATWQTIPLNFINNYLDRIDILTGSHFNSSDNFWIITEDGKLYGNQNNGSNTLNVTKYNNKKNITVYPNPITNVLRFLSPNSEIKMIEIFNLNGARIIQKKLDNKDTINISNLTSGLYFIRFTDNNGNRIQKKFLKN